MTNQEIANQLRRRASILADQGDNLYRVRAFRQAAMTVLALPQEVETYLSVHGAEGLARLPGIGRGLADKILQLCQGRPQVVA